MTEVLERTRAALAAIAAAEPRLKAFVALDPEGALARAEALDRLAPSERGPLHGLLFAVKEIIDRTGRPAGWGSPVAAGRVGPADAAIVTRLLAAGAIPVGETASTELAIGAAGPTRNPHDPSRTPGGSSSGSGAAVGAGLLPFALATQTLGSVVRPAAYCGAVGYKPRRGAIDRAGVMPLAPRLDALGFIAESLETADRVARAVGVEIAGAPSQRALRLEPWFAPALSPEVLAALDAAERALRAAGWSVERAAAPEITVRREAEVTEIILAYEAAAHHGAALDHAPDLLSAAVRELLARGRGIDRARYDAALAEADAIAAALLAAIPPGAAVLAPATLGPPPRLEEGTGERAPQRLWSLVDWPALSVPALWSDGLPLGAQVLSRPGEDAAAFAAAAIISAATPPPA